MNTTRLNLLLADDDIDDCIFFMQALKELPVNCTLNTVNDGVDLMDMLNNMHILPDMLFLDLNMPRKTGYECLSEIKLNEKINKFPVIVFSTSIDYNMIDQLYQSGAQYYIRKPGEFAKFKQVIHSAILFTSAMNNNQPVRNDFILNT